MKPTTSFSGEVGVKPEEKHEESSKFKTKKSANDKIIQWDNHLDIIDATRKHSVLYKEDIIENTDSQLPLVNNCV